MKRAGRAAVVVAALLLVAAIGVFLALPTVLVREVQKEARAQGIELTIERAELSFSEVTFQGIKAKLDAGPLEAKITTVFDLALLLKRRVVIRDGSATVRDVLPNTSLVLRQIHGALERAAGDPQGPLGSAAELGADVELTSADPAGVARRLAGPWKLSVTRGGERLELALDLRPAAPNTAVLQRSSTPKESRVRVAIHGARLEELALPAVPFASGSSTVDLDVAFESRGDGSPASPSHRGNVKLTLSRFAMPGAPVAAAMSTSFDFEATGTAGRVVGGRFSFGPFAGSVAGGVELGALPRLSLELTGNKTACAALAKGAADEVIPGAGALAASLGLDRAAATLLQGDVGFVAQVDVSLAALGAAKVDVRPVGGCTIQIPLFKPGTFGPK